MLQKKSVCQTSCLIRALFDFLLMAAVSQSLASSLQVYRSQRMKANRVKEATAD